MGIKEELNGICADHEFTCSNNRCVDSSLMCNDIDDCGDNSDEGATCNGNCC